MAIQPACNFDLLCVNDGYFPSFSHQNELQNELSRALLDAEFAEELQFQEALKASLTTCQTPSNVAPSQSMNMEAIQGPNLVPSLHVKEKGESSLSHCEICLERKENDQMIKNERPDPALCLDCSKTIELLKKQWHCKELSMKVSCGNDGGKPFTYNTRNNPSQDAKTNQFSQGAGDIVSLNSAKDDGKWEASASKYENRAESSTTKLQGPQNPNVNAWGHKNVAQNSGLPRNANSKIPFVGGKGDISCNKSSSDVENNVTVADDSSDSDALNDTNEFDSDTNQKNLKTFQKLSEEFFERLEKLLTDKFNEPNRQWHCPACQGGPGANRWYRGLQALISHAKAKGKRNVKHHREPAQLLEEKLCSKETSAVPAVEAFGKWKGLEGEQKDYKIVWPPMVVIRNTSLKKDENNKWIGMTNQELLHFFSSYDAIVKAQQGYSPLQGHCGMSVLIFEASARGYLEAERLHKHFEEQGIGRNAWNHRRVYCLPGGERQLHGYMALKEDMDMFNQYSKAKPNKLKYEMKSYQEMVVNQIRRMSEDNCQLMWLKNRVTQEQGQEKVLEQNMRERLDKAMKEIHVLRHQINLQHEQNKEEMDFQEQFFKEQMKVILEAKEGDIENAQQQQEEEEEGNENSSDQQDYKYRVEETVKLINNQAKEKEEVVADKKKKVIIEHRTQDGCTGEENVEA